MSGSFSWDLLADLQDMWSLAFMVNAFRAGTIAAVLAGPVGWFMVIRRQNFAGHTLAVVGFPGAAGAIWAGVSIAYGYFAFCLLGALAIAILPGAGSGAGASSGGSAGDADDADASAITGTVQAFALACGMAFLAWHGGFLDSTTSLLFGSFLGITTGQVTLLAAVAVVAVGALGLTGRALLFASVDPDVARAQGLPTRWLAIGYLVLLAVTVSEVGQITGALLVFALLVLPAATAQRLTARPGLGVVVSVGLALVTVWTGLFVGYYSPYPIGFWLTSIAFAGYVAAHAGGRVRNRLATRTPRRPTPAVAR